MAENMKPEVLHSNPVCLHCRVSKFWHHLDLNGVQKVTSSLYGLFTLRRRDGMTNVVRLNTGNVTSIKAGKLKSVFWDQTLPGPGYDGVLFAQDHNGTVMEIVVMQDKITLRRTIEFQHLMKAVESYSHCKVISIELVGFERGYLLFVVNSDTLCTAEIDCNMCLPCSWIPLPGNFSPATEEHACCFQVIADVIVVLDRTAQLLLFNLHTGENICQIDLEPSGFCSKSDKHQSTTLLTWGVSPYLEKLVWVDSSGNIYTLNLEKYTQRYPLSVTISKKLTDSSSRLAVYHSLDTCHTGSYSWRQILTDLHLERKRSASGIWSSEKLATTAREKKVSGSKFPATGFKSRQSRKTSQERLVSGQIRSFIRRYCLPSGNLLEVGYKVLNLQVTSSMLAMVLISSVDCDERAVCLVDFSSKQFFLRGLSEHHHVVLSRAADLPVLMLAPEGLILMVSPSNSKQEDIVSRMMVYSNAQSADHLCHLNGWGHTTVPLHGLELGLQQRQLDTVTFFLQGKQSIFSEKHQDSTETALLDSESMLYRSDAISQLAPAFDLFLKTIRGSSSDIPTNEFSLRLVSHSLDFLHALLKDGLILQINLGADASHAAEREDLDKALSTVMDYIAYFRDALLAADRRQETLPRLTTGKSIALETAEEDGSKDDVDGACRNMLIVDSVEQACSENSIPVLQAQLLGSGHSKALWPQLVRIMLQQAWYHLQQKDITAAQSIISNLGLDVGSTIWEMANFTTDRSLQQFLIQELKSASALSLKDLSLVDFLQQLYRAYPSALLRTKVLQNQKEDNSGSPVAVHLQGVRTNVPSRVQNISGVNIDSKDNEGPYCVMALHWLQNWNEETKEQVLLEAAVLSGEINLTGKFSTRSLWHFWLARNSVHQTIQALDAAVASGRDSLKEYLLDLPLCAKFVQHQILTHLLKTNTQHWNIMESLNLSFEERIHMLNGLLHTPHPISQCGASVMSEFHRQFAEYCAQVGLIIPLWIYCSTHQLDAQGLLQTLSSTEAAWFKPFAHLYSAVKNHSASSMFSASLSIASILWKADDWTLARLLKEGHVTAAIATMSFLPETESVTQGTNQDILFGVKSKLLRSTLQRYPKLLSALLPPDADSSRFDINVYQLLLNNAPLNTRRLFGWQSTNTTAGEDKMKSLPFFSHPEYVKHFAHTEKLNFTFYLKRGRPCYAFISFLAEELEQPANVLSPRRLHMACGVALWLAIKHFHNSQISSACVAFVEMMGRDSIVLRAYISAGEVLLAHSLRNFTGPAERRKEQLHTCEEEVVNLMQSCLWSKHRNGRRFLTQLEDATVDEIANEGLSSTSIEAALKWTLVILVCHNLRLPLSTRFLEACAREDCWLPFVWFAQLHQFPKTQLKNILHLFPSRHLRDHLQYVITNASFSTLTSPPTDTKAASSDKNRNSRSWLYSKIGLHAANDRGETSSDEDDESQLGSSPMFPKTDEHLSTDEDFEVTEESAASDVFRVLFSALATPEPWKSLLMHAIVLRNPLFAELAGCCGASMVLSLCAWLLAMLTPSEHDQFLAAHRKRIWHWKLSELEQLISLYLCCSMESTLATAFFIFLPKSPMLPFLQFIANCVQWRDYEGCKVPLDHFKDLMAALSPAVRKSSTDPKSKSRTGVADGENDVIGNRDWLERIAYHVLCHELIHCASLYDALNLLILLTNENIALVFSFDVMDFGKLLKMVDILHRNRIDSVHFQTFFNNLSSSEAFQAECQKALEALMAREMFEEAQIFAQSTGLELAGITLRQMASEKQKLQSSGVWTSGVMRLRYWDRCVARITKNKLSPDAVAPFFHAEVAGTESFEEKGYIFQLLMTLVEPYSSKQDQGHFLALKEACFISMWGCRIKARVQQQHLAKTEDSKQKEDIFRHLGDTEGRSILPADRHELLHVEAFPAVEVDAASLLSEEESHELQKVLGELLAMGHISDCCRLVRLLDGHCTDLDIILTCIKLCTGSITVETIDLTCRHLLTTGDKRPSLSFIPSFSRTSSTLSLASTAPCWNFLPSAQEEIICTLEQLLNRCGIARPCCLRIITVYKIACLTGHSYKDILMTEEFSVLRQVLKTDFTQRYILAKEYLSTSSVTAAEVASFLVEEILKSLRIYLGGKDNFDVASSKSGKIDTSELIFRPTEGGEVFGQLISLCSEPALLGDKLLSALAALASNSPEASQSVLSMETELLIMAHECHSVACNMEGISNVLRAARVCAQCLASASQYQLMIRLLTGIGRYSEMTYIFEQLQQHHQFEVLLRKGIVKEDRLKVAVLDYLKRFHSDDSDSYSMVALNFSMYREIALMLDDSGHRNLALLKDKPLDANKDTHEMLKKCIQFWGDAAESYVKDKCFKHAQTCLRWARLVNLQLQLLGSGIRVINLSAEEVKAFVSRHPKFPEAYVVSEAYGTNVDWAEALYQNVVLHGNMRYLQDFRTYIKLSASLVQSALLKLKQAPGKLTDSLPIVKKLLKMCPDVWMQYKIAQELGLIEITRELLRNDSSSFFIKDLLATQ